MTKPPLAQQPQSARFHANSLGIGEIGAGRESGQLRTFVGSCVGLALYDRRKRIASLAHIMLPDSKGAGEPVGKYADTAIPEMLKRLESLANGEPLRLSAKMAGGAKMFAFQSGLTIGDQNVAAIEAILGRLGIPLLARECGGERGRRLSFDIATTDLTIETLGMPHTTL
ncbi:MAG: chemotaxis protein CheD [Planctomycetia bacterium]